MLHPRHCSGLESARSRQFTISRLPGEPADARTILGEADRARPARSSQYTQLRVAAATIAFVWVLGHALWLPFEKSMMPLLPLRELGLLILFAWFLVVPAFCESMTRAAVDTSVCLCSTHLADGFVVTVVNKDDSPFVCSTVRFGVDVRPPARASRSPPSSPLRLGFISHSDSSSSSAPCPYCW